MTGPDATTDARDALTRARAPLHATRRTLAAAVAARALLWGGSASCTVLAGIAVSRGRWDGGAVATAVGIGLLVAILAGAMALRGGRRTWSTGSVALWLEARLPALRYALVTLADEDAHGLPAPVTRALADRVRATPWRAVVARDVRRALVRPAAALLATGALALTAQALAPRLRAGVDAPRARAATPVGGVARRAVDPLARVRVTVTPPAYTREPARTLDMPPIVTALVGSALTIEGTGSDGTVRAALVAPDATGSAASALTVGEVGDGWRVALRMPAGATLLRLTAGARTRLLALEPRPDLTPRVTLRTPARDTVLREARGTLALRAALDDDLGLADGAFEYIVSSGEGESFTFRAGRVGATALDGARRGALAAPLDLAALALKPGDVVHLRAVARDRRPRAEDALGVSETRALRVARASEYDSVAVEGAPPPAVDTTAIGQRMILQLTEALVARAQARRAPLARPVVVNESRKLAVDQARLRRRVGDVVFARLGEGEGEHAHFEGDGHQHGADAKLPQLTPEQLLAAADRATGGGLAAMQAEGAESPVLAVNKPLLEAYNHMWDAGRALEIGEPRNALAPMRRAIAALQRARAAERIYLRGRPPTVVVDLNKVRGAGRVSGDTLRLAARTPRAALDPAARARAATLDRALALLGPRGDAAAATDSLAVLRVRALGDAPALASALGDALAALAAGRDATAPLTAARRAALGQSSRSPGVSPWTAGWSDAR